MQFIELYIKILEDKYDYVHTFRGNIMEYTCHVEMRRKLLKKEENK